MTDVTTVCLVMLSLAGALSLVRLVLGPSVPDRLVALDTLLVLVTAGIAVLSARTGDGAYLILLVVVGLLGFVGTVTASRFVERRGS